MVLILINITFNGTRYNKKVDVNYPKATIDF